MEMVANNAELPTEILEHILKFLSFGDIKSCRLVNQAWRVASKQLVRRKVQDPVKLLVETSSTWGEAERLIACINGADGYFPRDNFEVKINLYTMFMSTPLIGMFVEATFKWIKELTISILYIPQGAGYHASDLRIQQDFMSLRSFTLKLKPGRPRGWSHWRALKQNVTDREVDIITRYAASFIGTANLLQNVTLEISEDIYDPRLLSSSIVALGIGNNLKMRLTTLCLSIRLEDSDWTSLISQNLQLKSLKLYMQRSLTRNLVESRFMEQFLGSVAETLSLLEIHDNRYMGGIGGIGIDIVMLSIPTLKNLNELTVWSCETLPVPSLILKIKSFKTEFPVLVKLCLRDFPPKVVTKMFLRLESPIEPLVTLKSLALPQILNDQAMDSVPKLFPNLTSLHLFATRHGNSENVLLMLPQLEELSYATAWSNVHFRFFPESLKQNLKILRFENKERFSSGLGFSRISVELLMEMESLELLDLTQWPVAFPLNKGDTLLLNMMTRKFTVKFNAACFRQI